MELPPCSPRGPLFSAKTERSWIRYIGFFSLSYCLGTVENFFKKHGQVVTRGIIEVDLSANARFGGSDRGYEIRVPGADIHCGTYCISCTNTCRDQPWVLKYKFMESSSKFLTLLREVKVENGSL
jgi:hypothetical protein